MMTKGGSYQPSSPGHIVSYIGEKTDKKIPQFIPSGDGIWPPKDKLWGKVKHVNMKKWQWDNPFLKREFLESWD